MYGLIRWVEGESEERRAGIKGGEGWEKGDCFDGVGWEKGDGCGGVFLEKVARKVGVCKKKSNKKHFFVENIW